MTSKERAERIVADHFPGTQLVKSAPAISLRHAITSAIDAAVAAEREAAAAWHDQQAAELQAACDAAWGEVSPDLGLHAIKVHRDSAAAIRARQ